MDLTTYCYDCRIDTEAVVKEELIRVKIGDINIEFEGNIAHCRECGEEVYISSIEDVNIEKGNSLYREALGIIQTNEISKLLEMYNMSAQELNSLLGWKEDTISRYLEGLTPNKVYSDKLKELLKEGGKAGINE